MRYLLALTLAGLSASAGCQSSGTGDAAPTSRPAVASAAGSSVATLIVHGLACPLCANNLDKQLLALPGVEKVHVDLGNGSVLVTMAAASHPTHDQIAHAVQQSGYTLVRIDMP
jgi:copper chaperone CopZ